MITSKMAEGYTQYAVKMLEKAYSLGETKEYKKSLDLYSEVIGLCPKPPYAYAMRGFVKSKCGQHVSAIKDFDEAIKRKPDSPITIWQRAIAKEQINELTSAIEDYKLYSRLRPEDADTYVSIGLIHQYLKNFYEAIKYYKKAIDIDNECSQAKDLLKRLN